jgi:hypothetical protein
MLYSFFWVISQRRVNKTYEDGTDRWLWYVDTYNSDAVESPKRKNTTIIILFFHSCTVHLDIIEEFFFIFYQRMHYIFV